MTEARRGLSIRGRMMLIVVGFTALALTLAGLALWASEVERVETEIDSRLTHTAQQVEELAGNGSWTSTSELLRSVLTTQLPSEHEQLFAVVESRARYSQTPVAELDAQLVQAAAASTAVQLTSTRTATTTYRWLALPVEVTGTTPGILVAAFDLAAARAQARSTLLTYGAIAALSLALVAAAAWILLGRSLAPVAQLRRATQEMAHANFQRRVPVRGSDDIAQLAAGFNHMADQLTAVFDSQRQLLDDAGHELRTPITVVRGHLELMDPADPVDAAETRALALDELDRMHRLADDLVMLARSGRPDFVVRRATDVHDLTRAVFEHAQQLGDRAWRLVAAAQGVVDVDDQRLTQAWLQLAANAVKFSEAGSRVEIGSELAEGALRLWVTDKGLGIAAEDRARIFQRFAQAGHDRGGAGLGLPIVAAIAQAHGGRVDLVSAEGIGSTFTIVLPVEPEPEP